MDAATGMETPEEFQNLVIRQDNDRQVRLADVADVELAAENNQSRQFSSGRDTVFVSISPAPDANPLAVSRAVHEVLPYLRANLPADMELIMDFDGAIAIEMPIPAIPPAFMEQHGGHDRFQLGAIAH